MLWKCEGNISKAEPICAALNSATFSKGFKLKCTDLNRYTFSLFNIEEKVYLFKSAHFSLGDKFLAQFDLNLIRYRC